MSERVLVVFGKVAVRSVTVLIIGMVLMTGCGDEAASTTIGTLKYCECDSSYALVLPDGQSIEFAKTDIVKLTEIRESAAFFSKAKIEQLVRLPQKRVAAVLLKEPSYRVARWQLWHFDTIAEYDSYHEQDTSEATIDLDKDALMQQVAALNSKIEVLEEQVKKLDWLRSDIVALRADVLTAKTISEQNIVEKLKAQKILEEKQHKNEDIDLSNK